MSDFLRQCGDRRIRGPTAVMNESLVGVVEGLGRSTASGKVGPHLGHAPRRAREGGAGAEGLVDLDRDPLRDKLERLARHPRRRSAPPATNPTRPIARNGRGLPRQRQPLFLYSVARFGGHCRIVSEKAARRATSFAASMCRRPSTSISGERPHAGLSLRRALVTPRADGRRARQ